MKKLKLTLGITAFAVGIFGAFAFTPAPKTTMLTTGQYYVNPDGSPTGILVDPAHLCADDPLQDLCSATFTIEDGQPTGTGTNFKRGPIQ